MSQVLKLDLNNPVFQKQLFDLAKEKQLSVLKTLRKLSNMTWKVKWRWGTDTAGAGWVISVEDWQD